VARRLHMDVSVQTGANKVESRGMTQSTFMPSTMNAVRIHGRGGPEFLKHEGPPSRIDVSKLQSRERFEAVHKTMNDHER